MLVSLIRYSKDRHRVFTTTHPKRTEQITRDGQPGHVRLLVTFPPMVAISRPVNSLTGVSQPTLDPQVRLERMVGLGAGHGG
jgi:REP element-mobilizing transposase RayT